MPETTIVEVNRDAVLPRDRLAEIVDCLAAGGCVVLPADTGYMLAVDASSEEAVNRLFELKGRPFSNPVHVAVYKASEIGRYAKVDEAAARLIERFMPGPITLVLPDLGILPSRLMAGTGNLGVRIPDSSVVLQVCAELERPLTATSANPAGVPPSNDVEDVVEIFEGRIASAVRVERFDYSVPSTVVAIEEGGPVVLREGPISAEEIAAAAG